MKDEDIRQELLVAMEKSESRIKPQLIQNDKVITNKKI
jgi:hypothetical protein